MLQHYGSFLASITQRVIWMDKAYEVWQELCERFSQGDLFRIADLQDEIASLKQGDQSVTRYFTELKILWDELDVFRPTPTCRCDVQCNCGAFQEMRNQKNSDRAIKFLKGLNEQFSTVRSQLMLLDPLPSINKIFSLVIQQERQFAAENNLDSKVTVNISDTTRGYMPKLPQGRGTSGYQQFSKPPTSAGRGIIK